MFHLTRFIVVLAVVAGLCSTAHATAISITALPGSQAVAYELTAPDTAPYTIQPNGYNDDTLWVWNEQQNVLLTDDLYVDWVADPAASYVTAVVGGYIIQAGTIVSSHYVQWDPAGLGAVHARIEFDSDIFGYISSDGFLADSDDILGLPGVTYDDFSLRGIEPPPHSNADQVVVDLAQQELVEIDWVASSPGDWVRLITAFSPAGGPITPSQPVPEPSAGLVFAAGLALVSRRVGLR